MKKIEVVAQSIEVVPETKIPRKGKAVYCINEGQFYKSAMEFATSHNIGYHTVNRVLDRKQKTCGGGRGKRLGGYRICYVYEMALFCNDIAEQARKDRKKAVDAEEKLKENELLMQEMIKDEMEWKSEKAHLMPQVRAAKALANAVKSLSEGIA